MHGGGSAPSCCAFTHRVAFEEGSGQQTQRPAEARLEIESSSPVHSGEESQTADTATSPTDASIPASAGGTDDSEATTTGTAGIIFL